MYHNVAPASAPGYARYTVTAPMFAAQMQWLALARYTTVTLGSLLDAWSRGAPLPKRPVVITFDDGFRDCLDFAVPVLRQHGFTALFYLVAGLVGQTSRWTLPSIGMAFPLMDWSGARELIEAGMECGAHSMTHPPLGERGPSDWHHELVEAREVLQDRLGGEIGHLAYPYGSVNPGVRSAARAAGYVSACTTEPGLVRPGDDLLSLRRVPVYGGESLLDFACRLRTAETSRQALRRRLPAGALALYRKLRGVTS
jgi:peptidoglycan/xylan/chitin deacetylase (PgdA/CDA1 family)